MFVASFGDAVMRLGELSSPVDDGPAPDWSRRGPVIILTPARVAVRGYSCPTSPDRRHSAKSSVFSMRPTEIVITGVGLVSSIGFGKTQITEALREGRSGVVDLRTLSPADLEDLFVGEPLAGSDAMRQTPWLAVGAPIEHFDAKQFVRPRKALKVMCREIQTSFVASQLALGDAGLDEWLHGGETSHPGLIRPDRIGTVFGSEMLYGQPRELADAFAACCGDDGDVDKSRFGGAAMQHIMPLWMLKYLPNMPACHVGIAIGALGPNNTLTLGDVSGPAALIEACGYIRRGTADVMVTAACGSRMNMTRAMFTEDQPLAGANNPVHRSSRPHAQDADGLVRGEGAASLIIERASAAERRNRRALVRVVGYASRFVASTSFRNHDRNKRDDATSGRGSADAMVLAINAAMANAKLDASRIGLVVSHAMGDRSIDGAEREALQRTLPNVPLTCPISLLGHTGAASGMAELAVGVISLEQSIVPPVPHAADCSRDLNVDASVRELAAPHVLILTHTSPGAATAVILKR